MLKLTMMTSTMAPRTESSYFPNRNFQQNLCEVKQMKQNELICGDTGKQHSKGKESVLFSSRLICGHLFHKLSTMIPVLFFLKKQLLVSHFTESSIISKARRTPLKQGNIAYKTHTYLSSLHFPPLKEPPCLIPEQGNFLSQYFSQKIGEANKMVCRF